jgi:hypothetical protein
MDSELVHSDYALEPKGLLWQPFNESGFVSPWAPNLLRSSAGINYVFSTLISGIVVVVFTMLYEECRHWCMLPIVLCGSLVGADIIAWFRKEIDSFDPKVTVAVFLCLTCFLAPQLHLAHGLYNPRLQALSAWSTYFGYMAWFNVVGIILLKLAHNSFFRFSRPVKKLWQIAPDRFIGILIPFLVISLAASAVIRFFFGGLVKEAGVVTFAPGSEAYASHVSWIAMLGDPAPMLIMIPIIYWIHKKNPGKTRSLWTVLFLLLFIAAFQFLWVGLRSSRTAILITVFLVAAIIHYRLRRFSIKFIILGMFVLFIFVYLYGFYKRFGAQGWQAFYSAEARESLQLEGAAPTPEATLVFSLARADVHAFMLYRLMEHKGEYHYSWGETYLMSGLTVIPRGVWKNKPTPKVRAGRSMMAYYGLQHPTHQYGLAGEAMLNFGYYGILPAFFVFGSFLGWLRKKIATMEPSDSRFFLIPISIFICTFFIIFDSDNLMQYLLRIGTLPFIVVFFGSTKSRFTNNYAEVTG